MLSEISALGKDKSSKASLTLLPETTKKIHKMYKTIKSATKDSDS